MINTKTMKKMSLALIMGNMSHMIYSSEPVTSTVMNTVDISAITRAVTENVQKALAQVPQVDVPAMTKAVTEGVQSVLAQLPQGIKAEDVDKIKSDIVNHVTV